MSYSNLVITMLFPVALVCALVYYVALRKFVELLAVREPNEAAILGVSGGSLGEAFSSSRLLAYLIKGGFESLSDVQLISRAKRGRVAFFIAFSMCTVLIFTGVVASLLS